ncbi:CGNR zinc finger domain-containing protein [Microbacterium halotolerans]|uniref:CGNR zinc finger domain-containing protein n=1 Tax=Microbacterium halotolerans TaxID=246613 RepID=UPI000E6AD312|nr:CGNR zinc finger domain-containing protein [Microbacterium halotolerans]
MVDDETVLLDVLNSAPRLGGVATDMLEGAKGVGFARRLGGAGTDREVDLLRQARDAIQWLVRGRTDAAHTLQALMDHTALTPAVTPKGIQWNLVAAGDALPAARIAQAWSRVNETLPGRLKACANEECNLFLIDHTRPGTAKWCSMATCGNRMKARAHASRVRSSAQQR